MKRESKIKKEKRLRKIEQNSTDYFFKVYKKIGLTKLLSLFLSWAEKNRKAMYFLLISFLFLVTLFSIFSPVFYRDKRIKIQDELRIMQQQQDLNFNEKNRFSLEELENLMKLQQEIEKISGKEKMTKEDSIKIDNLYELIKENSHGKN